MIQDPQLREHRGLIPIETLVGDFAGLKLNDAHHGELDPSTRGRQARQHPIHIERMREADYKLFDNPIVAEDLRQGSEFEIRWDVRQEMMGVELAHSDPARPARS